MSENINQSKPIPKPILSIPDLIEKTNGQFITKSDSSTVEMYLLNIPYFDLIKGFKGSLLKDDENHFLEQLNIDYLYQIHWLNLSLSNLLLKYSLETEKHLKSLLIKEVGTYGDTCNEYLDPRNYKKVWSSTHSKIKNDICIDTDKKFSGFEDKYGYLSSWYLIEHVTFGRSIYWYSALLPDSKQKFVNNFLIYPINQEKINNEQDDDKRLLITFLKYTLEMRNKAAHGNRIINLKLNRYLDKRVITLAGIDKYFKRDQKGNIVSDMSNFIAITILLTEIPIFAVSMMNEIINFFEINSNPENSFLVEYLGIDAYKLFGFTKDDKNRLLKLLEDKFKIK